MTQTQDLCGLGVELLWLSNKEVCFCHSDEWLRHKSSVAQPQDWRSYKGTGLMLMHMIGEAQAQDWCGSGTGLVKLRHRIDVPQAQDWCS